ncbi:MAG: hypothetical protein ACR2Q3_11550 [Woeseiaceae bacterium]
MDEFEKRLKQDADAVEASVSPQLRARIDASLRSTERARPTGPETRPASRLWWASSLTGLTATIAFIAVLNMNRSEPPPAVVPVADMPTVPDTARDFPLIPPELDIQSAEFAGPLEEELLRLRADIEKARNSVREDIDFTF